MRRNRWRLEEYSRLVFVQHSHHYPVNKTKKEKFFFQQLKTFLAAGGDNKELYQFNRNCWEGWTPDKRVHSNLIYTNSLGKFSLSKILKTCCSIPVREYIWKLNNKEISYFANNYLINTVVKKILNLAKNL